MRLPRLKSRPRWRLLAGAAVLGAGVALGQAPLGWWFVAVPALSLFLGLARSSPGWAGFAGGFGYALAGMFWITEPFLVEPEIFGWMAPFALILMAAGMGAFWALGAGLGGRRGLPGIALGLVAMDALRSYALTGFPWILFGHIWIGTPVAQAAAYVGPIGLSLLTLLLAVAFWRRWAGVVALLALAGIWGAGQMRLNAPLPDGPAVTVRLVQPNATQALKWDPQYRLEFFYRHLDLTANPPAPGAPRPDLVIWPETAVPFLLDDPGDGLRMAAEAAGGAPVAMGIQRSEGLRYYNSLAIIHPDGTVGPVYDKVHLVPFGEYIPYGDWLARIGISAFAAQQGNGYTAGQAEQVLDLGPLGRVQPLICYELIFPQDIRRVSERPDWIMLVTNDAWFGTLSGPWQHLAQAQLIAVEFGLPVARAANTGVSAMIDAKGRILDHLGMNDMGVIDARLPAALPKTLYARVGDGPALALLLIMAVIVTVWGNNGVDRSRRRV
ncbi:apolipoprotein N-acyltransferase [Paenirhodobacter sp.]|uniref:apolipoprotein N-acyltransferase n=1 Tax=Paenirhodobacter sp. TaxID=1965326 RepID=UPI003B409122